MTGCHRFAAATLGLSLLAGCGALDPFPTVPPPLSAGQATPAGQRVAICYNTLTASLAEVQVAGQAECPAGTTAEPVDTDYHVQNCPLLLPGRATFRCAPKQ